MNPLWCCLFTDLAFQLFSRFQLHIPAQRSKSLLRVVAAHNENPYPRIQQRPADGLCPHGPGLAAALGSAVCCVQCTAPEKFQLLWVCLPRVPENVRPPCIPLLLCYGLSPLPAFSYLTLVLPMVMYKSRVLPGFRSAEPFSAPQLASHFFSGGL